MVAHSAKWELSYSISEFKILSSYTIFYTTITIAITNTIVSMGSCCAPDNILQSENIMTLAVGLICPCLS